MEKNNKEVKKKKIKNVYSLDEDVIEFIRMYAADIIGTSASGMINQHFKVMMQRYYRTLEAKKANKNGGNDNA